MYCSDELFMCSFECHLVFISLVASGAAEQFPTPVHVSFDISLTVLKYFLTIKKDVWIFCRHGFLYLLPWNHRAGMDIS